MMLAHVAPNTQRRRSPLWTPATLGSTRRALAQQERESQGPSKSAFELGWDFARYGLDGADMLREDQDFSAGFRAGRSHWPRRRTDDRYVRKWLQLRASALVRGVGFSEAVTPAYLQSIDKPVCPVTRKTMTRCTGEPTDVSVDRINNAIGYHPGNLVVMSVLANGAKANLGSTEMLEVVHALGGRTTGSTCQGLGIQEWARLATLAAYSETFADPAAIEAWPLVVMPAPLMRMPSSAWQRKLELAERALAGEAAAVPAHGAAAFDRFTRAIRSAHADAITQLGDPVRAAEDAWLATDVNRAWVELRDALAAPSQGASS
ncbi:MAG: hypothetical protein HYX47_12715 [Burkholderiales bacterium]|nr:hypothetical protein [Burkholderiales bacterium]